MRTADVTTALLLAAGGVLVLWDSVRIGVGWSTDGPQSGFFPFWLAVALLCCCAAIVVQTIRRSDRTPFVTREAMGPVLKVLVPAIVFVVLIQIIGLYVATALYMPFYMRWIGRHSWLVVVALSIAIPVATFLVFEVWFLVPMPKGPLEAWLDY
ncbi:MAG TPA: tripartite tricarboxylate transporter TctB family protein [Candidatus Methylomirabilis sp.]|nr:tripartite tricarboxylate transporter TctB family protein [Candidatus Methylomirabilis sp.]